MTNSILLWFQTKRQILIKVKAMKRIIFIILCLWQGVMAGNNNHITGFIPDSLKTWQIRLMINKGHYYSPERFRSDLLQNYGYSINTAEDGWCIYFSPDIRFKYKKIQKRRELNFENILSYEYYQRWFDGKIDDNYRRYKDEIINSSKRNEKSVNRYFYNNISLTEYILPKFGINLATEFIWNYLPEEGSSRKILFRNDVYEASNIENRIEKKLKHYSIRPGIVLGRTYNGNYAAKAEEIILELTKSGSLKRELSAEEFNQLAQIVLEQMESYHFDWRIKKIESIEKITNYLKDIETVDSVDVKIPLTINDTYFYSYYLQKERMFGTKMYVNYGYSIRNSDIDIQQMYDVKKQTAYEEDTKIFLSDSIITDYSNLYKNISDTDKYSQFLTLGLSANKIKSWHFWYNMNLNYMVSIDNYIEKFQKKSEFINNRLDSTTVSDYYSKSRTTYMNHNFTSEINLFYQFDSRSILSTYLTLNYQSQKREKFKNSISSAPSSTYEYEYLKANLYVKFDYYLTPKTSVYFGANGTILNNILYKTSGYRIWGSENNDARITFRGYFNLGIMAYL